MKICVDQNFQRFLTKNKIDLATLLAEAKIPNLLWQGVVHLDEAQYFKFKEVLSHHLSDEQMLMVSDIENLKLFKPAVFAALSAANGLQALHRFSKYKTIFAPIAIDIIQDKNKVTVHIKPQTSHYHLSYFSVVNELCFILGIIRTGTNELIVPDQIQQPYQLGDKILEYFKTPSKNSQAVSITFLLADLEKPFFTKNNTMWHMIAPELERQLQAIKSEKPFMNMVHQELQKIVASGDFSLNILSQKLGMSQRTLQRKLKAEQTSFKGELQTVQFSMAVFFATQEHQTIEEIAYLVGYSEASAFSRAFKKWSGMTFKQYISSHNNSETDSINR